MKSPSFVFFNKKKIFLISCFFILVLLSVLVLSYTTKQPAFSFSESQFSLFGLPIMSFAQGDPVIQMPHIQNNSIRGAGEIIFLGNSTHDMKNCSLIAGKHIVETKYNISGNDPFFKFKLEEWGNKTKETHVSCRDAENNVWDSQNYTISIHSDYADFYGRIKDANGNSIDSIIDIYYTNGTHYLQSNTTGQLNFGHGITVEDGVYNVNITYPDFPIESNWIENVNMKTNKIKIIDVHDTPDEVVYSNQYQKKIIKRYGLNPEGLEADSITYVIPSVSSTNLYKCTSLNWTTQECLWNNWTLFRDDLIVGERYIFTTDMADPLFAEEYTATTGASYSYENRTEATNLGVRLHAPRLFMDFDEPTVGNYVKDTSIHNNFGANNGAIWISSCDSYFGGSCYSFDGINDYIYLDSLDTDLEEFTYSLWLNVTNWNTAQDNNYILSRGGTERTSLFIRSDVANRGQIRGLTYQGSNHFVYGSTKNLSTGEWALITMTYDLETLELYINGILQDSNSDPSGAVSVASTLSIGELRGAEGTGYAFNGSIDNVQIWDRALTANEILNLYNGTINNSDYIGKYPRDGTYSSLVFYNTTSTFWNLTLSTADTFSSRSGVVNQTGINLSRGYFPM